MRTGCFRIASPKTAILPRVSRSSFLHIGGGDLPYPDTRARSGVPNGTSERPYRNSRAALEPARRGSHNRLFLPGECSDRRQVPQARASLRSRFLSRSTRSLGAPERGALRVRHG